METSPLTRLKLPAHSLPSCPLSIATLLPSPLTLLTSPFRTSTFHLSLMWPGPMLPFLKPKLYKPSSQFVSLKLPDQMAFYYRKFSSQLTPYLMAYFNSLRQGTFPAPDPLQSHIAMITKTADDSLDTKAFRPISLLNEDVKLLGKILSTRINKYLHFDPQRPGGLCSRPSSRGQCL